MIDEKKLIMAIANWQMTLMPGWSSANDTDTVIHNTLEEVIGLIESQPPADQWIPCSERPPEEPCIYTVEDCSPYTVNKHGEPQRRTIILKPFTWEPYHRVIAWKPINIEPYKGVE